MSNAILEPPAIAPAPDAAEAYLKERGKPAPGYNHSIAQSNFMSLLYNSKDFRAFSELNLDLKGWRCVPDICVFPRREAVLQQDITWVTEAPLMAVEIFSPSQTLEHMQERVSRLLDGGVKSVWLLMPAVHVASIFQQGLPPLSATQGQLTDPATGLGVDVDALFS